MITTKGILFHAVAVVSLVSVATPHVMGQTSDADRLEKLERAVEQLQKRNAELEDEVRDLKARTASADIDSQGNKKPRTKVVADNKSSVENSAPPVEKKAGDKWKLSNAITELELSGDVRVRYEYRGGESADDSPLAQPGAGVAGHNDWQERTRERYRMRLALRGTLLEDWFFGVRLETSQNPRSTNVTFGDDTSGSSTASFNGPFSKTGDGVYVGQAYGGYKGFPDFILTAGKMPQPLVTTRLLWDDDINPEGLAEQWKHSFIFGETAEATDTGKDGKTIVSARKSEPFLKLDLFANFGQFVYDDANPENPLGHRATTGANGGTQTVPNTDAFLLAWQVGARFNFPHNLYAQIAPTLLNYTGNGDTFNVHFQGGDPNLTNAESLAQNQTGINSLLILDVPWEVGWKFDKIPLRLLGDFAVNLEGDDRAAAAGHRGKGDQRYAWTVGVGIGQLKKKHDWQLNVAWQRQDQYSVDPNLVDTEFFDTKLNLQGVGATAGYMITDAISVNVLYAHAWRADDDLGTGGGGDIGINPLDEFQLFQADFNIRF